MAVVIDDDVVNLVVDVDVEPRGAGNEFLTRSCLSRSRVVVGDVATAGDAAAAAAAAAAAGKARKNLEVQVDAAGVVAAAAVVATTTTTPDCLEVDVQDGCDVEAKSKMGTAKPGGKRGRSP